MNVYLNGAKNSRPQMQNKANGEEKEGSVSCEETWRRVEETFRKIASYY